jgi:hypothetical protein
VSLWSASRETAQVETEVLTHRGRGLVDRLREDCEFCAFIDRFLGLFRISLIFIRDERCGQRSTVPEPNHLSHQNFSFPFLVFG